jgi:hypothetical protein
MSLGLVGLIDRVEPGGGAFAVGHGPRGPCRPLALHATPLTDWPRWIRILPNEKERPSLPAGE